MPWHLRPTTPGDLPAACDVLNRSQHADGIPEVRAQDEFAEGLADDGVDLDADMRVAVDDETGAVLGYVHTAYLASETHTERCYLFGDVDPPARRQGIGTALMAFALERAAEQHEASDSPTAKVTRVQAGEHAVGAQRLFEQCGLRRVRYHETLVRPLDDMRAPRTPTGVEIIAWPADRDEEIRQAKIAAFAQHWGSSPDSPATWRSRVDGFGSRLDLSFVAIDTASGVIVGHCLTRRFEADDDVIGRREGWIDNLGTRPDHRGRGVASALIATALDAYATAGLTHAALNVDSENPSGAARLYRALGFAHERGEWTYEAAHPHR